MYSLFQSKVGEKIMIGDLGFCQVLQNVSFFIIMVTNHYEFVLMWCIYV